MSVLQAIALALLVVLSYPYVWLTTFNPNLKVRIHLVMPDGTTVSEFTNWPPPPLLSSAAAFWSLILGVGLVSAKLMAAHRLPSTWLLPIAEVTAWIGLGKLIAAWSSNLKSYQIDSTGARRPLKVRASDYIGNSLTGHLSKLGMLAVLYGLIWVVLAVLGIQTTLGAHGLAVLVTWAIYAIGRATLYYTSVRRFADRYDQFRVSSDYASAVRMAPAFDRLIRSRVVSPPVAAIIQFLVLIVSVFPTLLAISILLHAFSWHFDRPPSAMNIAAFFGGPPILGWLLSVVKADSEAHG